jgi:hypothetical protein
LLQQGANKEMVKNKHQGLERWMLEAHRSSSEARQVDRKIQPNQTSKQLP